MARLEENHKIAENRKLVFGIDEAGRGPLAGPVIACAITGPEFPISNFQFPNFKIRDSKKMTPRRRKEVFEFLKADPLVEWGIGRVGERVIDKINILEATKLAMKRAVFNLENKLGRQAEFLLIDGNFGIALSRSQKSIVKGDEKVFLISLASIVAKVHRDRGMARYHKRYPQYGFDKHKGYGTRLHLEMLQEYGICKIHRKNFSPVRKIFNF